MGKTSTYVARDPDASGFIHYPEAEHAIWNTLITRQLDAIQGKACDEYLTGLDQLKLPHDRIPQLDEVNRVLARTTGWQVAQVPALISFDHFFKLLANKAFPVATFIRRPEELDYLQEPDIFHEIFGHCPLLTNPAFAAFTHTYGQLGYKASKEERVYLARLYWFTVEFGITRTAQDKMRIYGGGILSSIGETDYCFNSDARAIEAFDLLSVLRTPYRIDIMQPVYYLLDHFDQLFELSKLDLLDYVRQARQLGLLPARFPPKEAAAS
ncbi:phenylalanine 4-monooxygenase [Balneatrix alpica]|uniref:phenylalanine 4-monooxygenase n=1 Tax=Balneatrix alpica TaxID=75684 RepID=UPI00273845EE|nr:phenylalanine 4-monooxygenase [Balneatrix alpica]